MQEQASQDRATQDQTDREQSDRRQSVREQSDRRESRWSEDKIGRQGDRTAPVGSEEWAIYVANRIHSGIKDTESDARQVEGWIRDFRSAGGHGALGYESWDEFCSGWIGLQAREVEMIISRRRVVRQKARGTRTDESGNVITPSGRTLRRHGGRRAGGEGRGRRQEQVDNNQLDGDRPDEGKSSDNKNNKNIPDSNGYDTSKPKPASDKGGTSADYLTARIARDHPSVHKKMKDGQYRSVRQAAIDAGIIEDRTRVSFYADDPNRACRNIFKHMARPDIRRLHALLGERLEEDTGRSC